MTRSSHLSPFVLWAVFVSIFSSGCSKQRGYIAPNKPFANDSVTTENVTYSNFIHPLLQKNCSTCHGSGGSAEAWWLNDNTYENALRYGNPICKTMLNETMPPTPKFPFLERDKQLIQAWKDRGMPKD
jgi:hypothetical protein